MPLTREALKARIFGHILDRSWTFRRIEKTVAIMLTRLMRWADREFYRHRPAGWSFSSGMDFFWHEISHTKQTIARPREPIVSMVVADGSGHGTAMGVTLSPVPLGTQYLRVRLALAGGRVDAHAWAIASGCPLVPGDVCVFVPLIKQSALDHWSGPLVAKLAPAYCEDGYIVERQLSLTPNH